MAFGELGAWQPARQANHVELIVSLRLDYYHCSMSAQRSARSGMVRVQAMCSHKEPSLPPATAVSTPVLAKVAFASPRKYIRYPLNPERRKFVTS